MPTDSFRALVVDDDPIARKTVGFALSQEGIGCAYAADGNDALDRLVDEQFDIVVTDFKAARKCFT